MEELSKKCETMRKSIKSSKPYQESDIYVILSPPDANAARTPCSTLLIAALEKLRESAGVLRSIGEPNLILVPHMADMPVTSHCFLHWDETTFCKNVALDIYTVRNIFDNKLKNLRPFVRMSNGKMLALYGPHPEVMGFDLENHQEKHESMKKAIKSIIASDTPRFDEFQLAVHAAMYSLNCEHCLSYILNPLNTIEKLQKFVKILTKGVWSPRDRKEMKTTLDWVDEKGKKCMKTCWRLDERVLVPKVGSSKIRPECGKNQKEHHLKTLQNVMQLFSGNIQKLGDETDFDKMEKSDQMARKLKAHNIGLSLLYMELENARFEIGPFGFATGDEELDGGLERAAGEMLKQGDFDITIPGIIARMDKETLIKYKQIKEPLRTEKGLIDRIAEKLRKIVGMLQNSEPYEEAQESTSSESSSDSSDSESESDTQEDSQKTSDTSEESDAPEMSPPKKKKAKLEKGAGLKKKTVEKMKPTSSTPKRQTSEPRKTESPTKKPTTSTPKRDISESKKAEVTKKPTTSTPIRAVIEAKSAEISKKPTSSTPKEAETPKQPTSSTPIRAFIEAKEAEIVKKPKSIVPEKHTMTPKRAETPKIPPSISPEIIDIDMEEPEKHEKLSFFKNTIPPKKKTSEVKESEIIEIDDDDEEIQTTSPREEIIFEHPGKDEELEPEPVKKSKLVSYARRIGKPYVPGDSEDDDEDSEVEEVKGAELMDDEDDEISVIFVKRGTPSEVKPTNSADSSFNFTVMDDE